jgi:DNA uptake protein ComE-like DNA-binding protein
MKAFWTGVGISAGIGLMTVLLRSKERERRVRATLDRLADRGDAAVGRERASSRPSTGVVSLNTVSREELLQVFGIGPVLADRIIANRPYENDYDVVERGIIPESGYKQLQSELISRRAG